MSKLRSQIMAIRSVLSTVDPDLQHIQAGVETRVINGTVVTIERGLHRESGIAAYNSYRWTFSPDGSRLDLAHLRFGAEHPVELVTFDLSTPIEHDDGSTEYQALAPHLCKDDLYGAVLRLEPKGDLVLTWRITGPKKDQTIVTRYSTEPQLRELCHQDPQVRDLCYQEPHPAGSHVVKM